MPAGASTLDVLRLELGKKGEVVEVVWEELMAGMPSAWTLIVAIVRGSEDMWQTPCSLGQQMHWLRRKTEGVFFCSASKT